MKMFETPPHVIGHEKKRNKIEHESERMFYRRAVRKAGEITGQAIARTLEQFSAEGKRPPKGLNMRVATVFLTSFLATCAPLKQVEAGTFQERKAQVDEMLNSAVQSFGGVLETLVQPKSVLRTAGAAGGPAGIATAEGFVLFVDILERQEYNEACREFVPAVEKALKNGDTDTEIPHEGLRSIYKLIKMSDEDWRSYQQEQAEVEAGMEISMSPQQQNLLEKIQTVSGKEKIMGLLFEFTNIQDPRSVATSILSKALTERIRTDLGGKMLADGTVDKTSEYLSAPLVAPDGQIYKLSHIRKISPNADAYQSNFMFDDDENW